MLILAAEWFGWVPRPSLEIAFRMVSICSTTRSRFRHRRLHPSCRQDSENNRHLLHIPPALEAMGTTLEVGMAPFASVSDAQRQQRGIGWHDVGWLYTGLLCPR